MNKYKDTTIILKELLTKSRNLMIEKDYKKAVDIFTKILEINPYLDDIWLMKGTALQLLQDFNGALECYNQALKLDPTNTKAQLGKVGIETHLQIQPARKAYTGLDLTVINKNIKKLVQDKLKNDALFQKEFILSKEERD